MEYDFDEIIDRVNTNDMKWHPQAVESYLHQKIPEDMIPMWLADTDFACAPAIVDAVCERAKKRIYGYCAPGGDFFDAIVFWQEKQHHWDIQREWISMLPTVLAGINIAIRTFSKERDGVIIQQPVYDPFSEIIENTGRKVVNNGLIQKDGQFEICFEQLKELASREENTMMILCSPHNPVGRVWTKQELKRIADICIANHVMLIIDEIHGDIVFNGHVHRPLLSLDQAYADQFILLSAPGKTFNIPGLKVSYSIIPNEKLRSRFVRTQIAMSLNVTNTFGMEALTAAYSSEGWLWMKEELDYIQKNVKRVQNYIETSMPGVTMVEPEGTYLCWLDLSRLGFDDKELFERIILKAGVICVPGPWFGEGGKGHMRLNVGCPSQVLMEALERIRKSLYES